MMSLFVCVCLCGIPFILTYLASLPKVRHCKTSLVDMTAAYALCLMLWHLFERIQKTWIQRLPLAWWHTLCCKGIVVFYRMLGLFSGTLFPDHCWVFVCLFFIPLSSWFDCCKLMTLSHRLINAIKKWLSNYHILIVTQSHRVGQWQLSRLLSVSCLTTTTTTTQSWVAADCMWVNLCDMHAAPYTLWTLVGIADHCVSWPVRLSVFVQVPCSECGRYRSCGRWYCHLSRVTAACSLLQFVLPQIFLLSLSAPYSTSWTVNGCQ